MRQSKKGMRAKNDKRDNYCPHCNAAIRRSLAITFLYMLFGTLWITLSDSISYMVFEGSVFGITIFKGLLYVFITSCLIFVLVYPPLRKNIDAQRKLSMLNEALAASVRELEEEKAKQRESEERIKASEALFHAVFDQVPIGIALLKGRRDSSLSYVNVPIINPMFADIAGRPQEEYRTLNWQDTIYPEDLKKNIAKMMGLKSNEGSRFDADMRIIRHDGSLTWIHMTVAPLSVEKDGETSHICIMEDIGQRKKIEEELFNSERSMSVLLDNLPGMAYRCKYDRDWTMLFISGGCLELTGYRAESLLENSSLSFNDIIAPEYRELLWSKWEYILKIRGKLQEEYEIITSSGEKKWVWEQGQGIYNEHGEVIAIEGLIIDITQRKIHEIQLKYINSHEMLTNIYNRRYLHEVLSRDFDTGLVCRAAIILINIKKFSQINTNYGYLYGENLIKELADCLKEFTDINTQLFHVSVDRFVIYHKAYKDEDELRNKCGILTARLNTLLTPRAINGNIGVVEIDKGAGDIDGILKKASIAIENADNGINFGYGFFDSATEQKINRRIKINEALKEIAYDSSSESIFLLYQPVISLKDNSIYGFEALVRFRHKELGLVMPDEFIPLAEESNLIVPLGITIMRRSFAFLKSLENRGYSGVFLLINISPLQLLRDDFVPYLSHSVEWIGVDARKIIVEITENVFADDFHKINNKLNEIRSLGMRVAIDDFGTGYSSLAREGELNIDCLKIDKYFIDKLNTRDRDSAVTGDIISMAHRQGHLVIAEGVEHESQRAYLADKKCDFLQGYLFSRPLDENAAVQILKNST